MDVVATSSSFVTEVTTMLEQLLTWLGTIFTSLLSGTLAPLLPFLVLGIAISLVMLAVRVVRKVCWGA